MLVRGRDPRFPGPNERRIIQRTGHNLSAEVPEIVAGAVLELLNRGG